MNQVWKCCMLLAAVLAMIAGRQQAAAEAMLNCGNVAVRLTLTLLAAMTLWSGLMEILTETGDVRRIGGVFRKAAAPLFPKIRDEACWEAMSLNITANLLGLGNAATPAGIAAAKGLAAQGKDGLQALAMLLVINNAGLQLMPTTVIAMRQAAGSLDGASVWLPTLIVSAVSTATGVLLMLLVRKLRCGA